MGTVTNIDKARRRRARNRFCTECKTPWAMIAVHREHGMVIVCKRCGHVRATIPRQLQPAADPHPPLLAAANPPQQTRRRRPVSRS